MQVTEKRLMQTMDMILAKKKRIALAKRALKSADRSSSENRQGFWGRILSAATVPGRDLESILLTFEK